jgi:hypothetical protein
MLFLTSLMTLVWLNADSSDGQIIAAPRRKVHQRVVPTDSVPEVEPTKFQAFSREEAQAFNAAIPLSTNPNPPARPFRFVGSDEDRLRAVDCLAAAVLYEAGDDPAGQRAVAQVVLNRVRHPAFPKTVCDVVFQGSERRTGCQFTFTCDGALNRSYSDPAWDRARLIAGSALSGRVLKQVGHATHYHTDWVVPYWSASLDKIVAINTHLFFRWTGWWGTPAAFRFSATGSEPCISQLAPRFPEHGVCTDVASLPGTEMPPVTKPISISDGVVKPSNDDPGAFVVLLSAQDALTFPELAAFTCGSRPSCKFMGWIDPKQMPQDNSSKLSQKQLASISFSYLRERSLNLERALWNCAQFKRPEGQCLWSKAPPPQATSSMSAPPEPAVKTLMGVHFTGERKHQAQP